MNHCNGLSESNQLPDVTLNVKSHSENYSKLLDCGLSVSVAEALDAVFKEGWLIMHFYEKFFDIVIDR